MQKKERVTASNPKQKEITRHGVFLEVLGLGVLLVGRSGIGKSELAISLIGLGHHFIADDAVTLHLNKDQSITGTCNPQLQDFLEVRGLGILNIRKMYGDRVIKKSARLDLIVHLVDAASKKITKSNRLIGVYGEHSILGTPIPTVLLPIGPGRNLAILVEAAIRNQKLKRAGYDSVEDFCSTSLRGT